MSNLQSTSTAAHVWLRENIPTATGLPTFNRVLSEKVIPDNFIVVGKVHSLTQQWAGFGNGRRDEEYQISCLVRVFTGDDPTGDDIDTLSAAAWGYVGDVVCLITQGITINGLGGDPTLGGNVIFSELVAADEQDPDSPNGGIEVGVTFDIACRAQVVL